MKTIVIIGGGFCGTISAVNLARFSETPLRVVIVNRGFPTGRGIAYSTRRAEHLLNVAARNMSALADDPQHFVDWLRTRSEYSDVPDATLRETFVPRRVFGDYLRGLLFAWSRPGDNRPHVQIETLDGQAVDVLPRGDGAAVSLDDGQKIDADKVLLATGNQPPAPLPSAAAAFTHPRYCDNPWQDWERRLPERNQPIVLLGTGLTMIDAFLTLAALGWQGPIFAVSRNGLLPQSHFRGIEYPAFPPAEPEMLGLAALERLVEEHCTRLKELGANPAIVVDKLRPHTQRIWQNFTLEEKRQFSRRHRARWNVTRHRIAPSIHQQMSDALARGALLVVKGRVVGLEDAGDRVRVTLDDGGPPRTLEGAMVINCTGPQESFVAARSPLFENLLSRGLARVDDMDMGISVSSDFSVLDRDGQVSAFLYAIGPLLKGTLWESVAVPELRGQALRVAESLLEACEADKVPVHHWPQPVEMDLLEYCI
jgi:uncharacterized NAD(P)/FAD-binding protein YdhS